jgi:hypothetical protein
MDYKQLGKLLAVDIGVCVFIHIDTSLPRLVLSADVRVILPWTVAKWTQLTSHTWCFLDSDFTIGIRFRTQLAVLA